jgi:two-component system sensor histidine kinase PilS (NtrC family)
MSRVETERELHWLMTLRVVTVTTLLLSAFGIEVLLQPISSLRPLFLLSASAYGMVLAYAVLERWIRGAASFLVLQLLGDTLLVTAFVQITGGMNSPLSFLYLLPICVAAVLLYRGAGLALALTCWLLYAAQALTGAAWAPFGSLVPLVRESDPRRVVYLLLVHLVALLAFALLATYLSERMRVQGRELAERQRAVARLKALNENIIESLNSGLITTNLEGQVNFMNRGGAQIVGLGQAEVEERGIEELFDLDEGFLRTIRQQLFERRRFRFERYYDTRDGRRIFLGFAVSTLHDRGGVASRWVTSSCSRT